MIHKILLLEDDKRLGESLNACLLQDGYLVTWCKSIVELLNYENSFFDIYLFDLNLPDGNSFDYFVKLKINKNVDVIMITAKNDAHTRLKAYENNISDFISKSFSYKELKLRIENVLIKKPLPKHTYFGFDFFPGTFLLTHSISSETLNLNPSEFKLLMLLCQNSPQIISRDQITNSIWGLNANTNPRSIDNLILNLRKTLIKYTNLKIESVWGSGYRVTKIN